MSILIKGIEMPKRCLRGGCPIDGELCDLWMDERYNPYQGRHPNCPLVEVSPHGDLIDRNALPWEKQGKILTDPDEWGIDARDIEAAPIIIPADKEET